MRTQNEFKMSLIYFFFQLMKGNSGSTTHMTPGDNPRYSAFLLHWCRAVEIITRELTLKNAPSLGKLDVSTHRLNARRLICSITETNLS